MSASFFALVQRFYHSTVVGWGVGLVRARVPIAPAQGPATGLLVVHEFGEFMLGMTRSVAEVWSTFDEDDGIALEPIEVRQLWTYVYWDAVAELVQRSLDPR